MNIEQVFNSYEKDIQDLNVWASKIYQSRFSSYFDKQRELFKELQNKQVPISDASLEFILIDTPITLFAVSEELNKFRLECELVKLRSKEQSSDDIQKEQKLILAVYNSIILQVESEVSFSRELIMSAKKIWDSRRNAENSMPVKEVTLPDYDDVRKSKYIK